MKSLEKDELSQKNRLQKSLREIFLSHSFLYFFILLYVYSPREIYHFLTSEDLRSVLGKSFYKRHMEDDDRESPFDTPEEIFLLEFLIASGYIIAEYRSDHANDSESYLISTMGHAYVKNYKQSILFRIRAWAHYSRILYWIIFASTLGSLIANSIWYYLVI